MASITKSGARWRAQVYKNGRRRSKSFESKVAAKSWAARTETELAEGKAASEGMTFGDLMDRYAREVSSKKRGAREEIVRIERLKRLSIAKVKLDDLDAPDFVAWREQRLLEVKGSTVKREMEHLSAVLNQAVREWRLLDKSPLLGVKRPKDGKSRNRLATQDELERCRYAAGSDLTKKTARTMQAFDFAVETAMRAGEIANLTWDHVYLEERYAHLPETKNGSSRDVPLSRRAVELLEELPRVTGDHVFGVPSASITTLWRKITERAEVDDLRFHDSRHMAVTQLARKMDVLDLARMTGHRNLSQLRTYYNAHASDIAKLLD